MSDQFEQLRVLVESEFEVDESLIEHDIPTFYVQLHSNAKKAFLRLIESVDPFDLVPRLRKRHERVVIQIIPKPRMTPNRKRINLLLALATVGTVFIAGYLLSPDNLIDTILFTISIMAILGFHEMGHKLAANRHGVEATYPYFIPGFPPIGTFGALIQQKSLPPNRDALFDLGASGPLIGFIVAIAVACIGIPLSHLEIVDPTTSTLPTPLLFRLIVEVLPPLGVNGLPDGNGLLVIVLHPLAYAGWIGMFVTLLNLVPAGMLDGGHVTRSFLGDRTRRTLTYVSIALLFFMGELFFFMAIFALFFSVYRHPGPLDDVSAITTSRKVLIVILAIVFVLCIDWYDLIARASFLASIFTG